MSEFKDIVKKILSWSVLLLIFYVSNMLMSLVLTFFFSYTQALHSVSPGISSFVPMLPGFLQVTGNTAANNPSTLGWRKTHSCSTQREDSKDSSGERLLNVLYGVFMVTELFWFYNLSLVVNAEDHGPERLPDLLASETWAACIHSRAPASSNSVPSFITGNRTTSTSMVFSHGLHDA